MKSRRPVNSDVMRHICSSAWNMRRFIIYFLGLFLILAGALVAYRRLRHPAPTTVGGPLALSLCELERHPEQYDGKLVQVKAVLYADVGGPYIYDWSCGSKNIYTYPLVDVRGFDGLTPELTEWVKNIGSLNAKGEGMEADVIVTGLFDKSYVNPGDGVFSADDAMAHHFRIIPKRLDQLSALHRRE